MPLEIPSRNEVVASLQAYVKTDVPELDPTVTNRRGWIGGKVRSLGSALHDWYVKLKRYGDREPFPQKASGDFLYDGWWSDITHLTRLAAAPASGRVVITGTAGTILPVDSTMTYGNTTFTVEASAAVIDQSLAVASLTRVGTTAIVETLAAEHQLATGMTITISGASASAYNGMFVITVTAANEFTYQVAGSPATPATGTIIASGAWGNALVTSTTTGQSTNVVAGSQMNIASPPSGLSSTAIVTFGALGGGTDIEGQEAFRTRILEALGTDFGMFSAGEIRIVTKNIPGVTRVWVVEASYEGTNGVLPGQVKVYFMRDLDADPFPSFSEIEAVTAALLAIKPAHMVPEDVMVFAPSPLVVNFAFSAISPSTASMQVAIRASLEQFFAEAVDLGRTITEDDYRCAIKNTFDPERGQFLTSFSLITPSGDITVASDQLPRLGNVTF